MSATSEIIGGVRKGISNRIEANAGEGFWGKVVKDARKSIDDIGSVGRAVNDTSLVRGNLGPQEAFITSKEALEETAKGLDEHIASSQSSLDAMKKNGYQNADTFKQQQMMQEEIDAIALKRKGIADSIEAGNQSGTYNYGYQQEPGLWDKTKNLGGQIKDYYTKGDTKTLATKAGVTAGAYVGGAIGLRYLSGGTLGTNNQGESDIAGIPFI